MVLKNKKGFTLVEIIIVVGIIALLSIIAFPNFANSRQRTLQNSCILNLKQLESAINRYAIDNNLGSDDIITMSNLIPNYIRSTPICPAGGTYNVTEGINAGSRPTCTVDKHVLP